MSTNDWFRRKTWTAQDREDFFTRLRRARGAFSKAQYARIQACELLEVREPWAYRAGLELLDLILTEWRDDAQLALVHHHRGDCLAGLGNAEAAVEAYRQVFDTQRVRKSERTGAHLDFGWLVATSPLPQLYDEALAVLDEFECGPFPVQQYLDAAIRALIYAALGDRDRAQSWARSALAAASARQSGFRYHAKLGLVETPNMSVHEKLQILSA